MTVLFPRLAALSAAILLVATLAPPAVAQANVGDAPAASEQAPPRAHHHRHRHHRHHRHHAAAASQGGANQ